MVKKIMMDMKLNGKNVGKTSEEKKETTKKPIQPIKKIVSSKETFENVSESFVSDDREVRNELIIKNTFSPNKRLSRTPQFKGNNKKTTRKLLLVIFIVSLFIFTAYKIALMFEKTTIILEEKHQTFALNKELFSASKNIESPIHFDIMIVSDTELRDLILTESQDISVKAKGVVTLYNEYSTKSQTLSKGIFIADLSGKTYVIDKATTIPGYKTDINKKIIPGKIDVNVTAFLPGNSYNIDPTSFNVSSFKNTPKYQKIYGKSSSAFVGGSQGLTYILGATEKGSLNAIAVSSFKSRLLKKMDALVPAGYILYPNAFTFTYNINENIQSSIPDAKVGINGTISAFLLKENDVVHAVNKNVLPNISDIERSEIQLSDISNLVFNFSDPNQTITKDIQSVSFTLDGNIDANWHPNKDKFKVNLLGISKKDLPNIFQSDPGIIKANATLFPPWKSFLPNNESRIEIRTN